MNTGYKKVIAGSLTLCLLIGSISYQVNNLTKENNELKIAIEQREKKISSLNSSVKEIEDKYKDINNKYKESIKENEKLEEKNKSLESKNKELEKENSNLEKKLSSNSHSNNSGSYNITQSEIDLLEKLVYCEAGVEPISGQIAVVNVVLNRLNSSEFPNTVTGVIMQNNQFSPVSNGAIYNVKPSEEVKQSVKRALNGEKTVSDDTVYFFATWVRSDHPIWNDVNITTQIGTHYFGN